MTATLAAIFTSSFVIALSGALMPGPVLTITITESTRRGPWAGPLMMLGHGILELFLIGLLLAGLAPFLSRGGVFVAVSIVGGAILLGMGIMMLKNLPSLTLHNTGEQRGSSNLVLTGIVMSVANPYWLIWWATIGLGYIMYAMQFGIAGVIAFFVGHIFADLAWYSLVSYGVAKGTHFMSDRMYRGLIGFCGGFLVLFSVYFFYSGITGL
ncbi:MAG TPA: lysine transporter LysE [Desulfofustis sp.]|jgi:threonine/homoserine/homoserine lactone efflux protein|nr:LysE family transporter [Desulfofustis sp. PB-SRB1]HBH29381.1 lysine transporter LysE [Desulfofustis sp.]HBH31652.1 lysine transporter LysE [Desulfofustis sp.]